MVFRISMVQQYQYTCIQYTSTSITALVLDQYSLLVLVYRRTRRVRTALYCTRTSSTVVLVLQGYSRLVREYEYCQYSYRYGVYKYTVQVVYLYIHTDCPTGTVQVSQCTVQVQVLSVLSTSVPQYGHLYTVRGHCKGLQYTPY